MRSRFHVCALPELWRAMCSRPWLGGAWMTQANAKLDSQSPISTTRPSPTQSGTHLRARGEPARTNEKRALVRQVLEHPNPILARPSVEVDPLDPWVVSLAHVLIATMRAAPGCVGLAAPQIGENVRVFAMNVTGHKKAKSCAGLVVLVNPRIIAGAGNVVMREGCLSVPHLTGDVARAAEVLVLGYEPGTGRTLTFAADVIEARCIQHEIDHLDGYLFVDRVLDPVAELFVRRSY